MKGHRVIPHWGTSESDPSDRCCQLEYKLMLELSYVIGKITVDTIEPLFKFL